MGRLRHATSAYLRAADEHPVEWHPWGAEPFALARTLAKPVLLDIGASWCHWCHVMDEESYRDPEIAAYVNAHFVAIRVDRDERPDVDARYQAAVGQLTGLGGWPLTAFLSEDGGVFFAGTHFPRRPSGSSPGFLQILTWAKELHGSAPEKRTEEGRSLRKTLAGRGAWTRGAGPEADRSVVEAGVAGLLDVYDRRNGGFGDFPKFPHPSALDLLIRAAARGHRFARDAAFHTLLAMARGALHDRREGGFHRYATDERWESPHLEKLLATQAELLAVLARAARDPALAPPGAPGAPAELAEAARGIARFLWETMEDSDRGGFAASRSAEAGSEVDRSLDAAWNGLAASAVLEAAPLLGHARAVESARRAIGRVRAEFARSEGEIARGDGIPPLLGDQAAVVEAEVRLFEATADSRWLDGATRRAERMVDLLWDPAAGAFRDRARDAQAPPDASFDTFPFDDGLHASGNALALAALGRLALHRSRTALREVAARLAATVARAAATHEPLALAGALAALDRHLEPPARVVLVAPSHDAEAWREAIPGTREVATVHFDPRSENHSNEAAPFLRGAGGSSAAFLCEGDRCSPPIRTPADLAAALASRTSQSAPS